MKETNDPFSLVLNNRIFCFESKAEYPQSVTEGWGNRCWIDFITIYRTSSITIEDKTLVSWFDLVYDSLRFLNAEWNREKKRHKEGNTPYEIQEELVVLYFERACYLIVFFSSFSKWRTNQIIYILYWESVFPTSSLAIGSIWIWLTGIFRVLIALLLLDDAILVLEKVSDEKVHLYLYYR